MPVAMIWLQIQPGLAGNRDLERLIVPGIMLAAGLSVLWFLLYWLLRGVFRIRIGPGAALRASWAMLLLPLLPSAADIANGALRNWIVLRWQVYPPWLPERAGAWISALIVSILGAALLYQIGKLSVRLTQNVPAWRWLRSQRRFLLFLPLLVISIPVLGGQMEANVFTFTGFFYMIDAILSYALLIGIITMIRLANKADTFSLTDTEQYLGAILFAWYISGHSATLLFIPIPFLLAWFLFRHWLMTPGYAAVANPAVVMKKVLDDIRASSRLDDLRKGLEKKFTEGEIKFTEYKSRVKEAEGDSMLAAAYLAAETGGKTPFVFAAGAEEGPWRNAEVAVKYGFLISLPFQFFTLANVLRGMNSAFPFLDFVYALVFSITTWMLTAAVFGYFFHVLRGRNGFEKALCFSLAAVVPSIPLRFLEGRSLADRGELMDALQVTAFALILSLTAFDLRTLQKYGRGWRDLMSVYGLASAAYGSTIAVAIASSLGSKELLGQLWSFLQRWVKPEG